MRSMLVLSSCLLALAGLLAGCNNQTPPRLYARMAWKMRCPNPAMLPGGCSMGCSEGRDRLVVTFTGEMGVRITCNVTETADQRILNFRIQHVDGYGVMFENVTVPRNGGSALSGRVRLYEDNEYVAAAGGTAPRPDQDQPCEVSSVTFFRDEESGDPTMRGQVFCQTMRAEASMNLCRGLSSSGGAGAATMPAEFTIYGCPGLVIPAP